MSTRHPVVDIVFCASSDATTLQDLETDLTALAAGAFTVGTVATAAELTAGASAAYDAGKLIPLVFVDQYLSDATGVDTLLAMGEHPGLRNARKVLLVGTPEQTDLERAAAAGALDGTLAVPWSRTQLQSLVSRLVTEFFIAEAPDRIVGSRFHLLIFRLKHDSRPRRQVKKQLESQWIPFFWNGTIHLV